jgi:superfamily I DNA/RNA helicase
MSQWMIQADKLDNEQDYFVFYESKKQGNKWLKGFPGTGKSVLLIHLILEKIEEEPNVFIAVVVFTNALRDMFTAAMEESKIPYRNVYLTTYHQFIKEDFRYEYVFCDEVQDLPQSVLENMRRRADKLIVAGDENQSIYKKDPNKPYEKVIEISQLGNVLNSKAYELETVYRLTKSIVKSVDILKPEMNIDNGSIGKRQDSQIRLVEGSSEEQEIEYVLNEANREIERGESVVILLPAHQDIYDFFKIVFSFNDKDIKPFKYCYKNYKKEKSRIRDYNDINYYMQENNMNLEYLGNGYGNLYNANISGKIIIMTYHSSKGLDFDNVFLPFQSRYFNNLYFPNDYDGSAKKTLFMVGMTRAKKQLY